jgi:hypothetical protein
MTVGLPGSASAEGSCRKDDDDLSPLDADALGRTESFVEVREACLELPLDCRTGSAVVTGTVVGIVIAGLALVEGIGGSAWLGVVIGSIADWAVRTIGGSHAPFKAPRQSLQPGIRRPTSGGIASSGLYGRLSKRLVHDTSVVMPA